MSEILSIRNVIMRRDDRIVLDVADLVLHKGEVLTVIGPNGAGKSTLLLVLSRLLKPDEGQQYYHGRLLQGRDDLAFRRRNGLVLQSPLLLKGTVLENVITGMRFRGTPKKEAEKSAKIWLKRFAISHLEDRSSRQLSGGEAQRTSLARAFSVEPEVLFLDEPFNALDTPTRTRILADFQAIVASTGMTTVFVTHDMDEALLLGDRVAILLEGKLRQIGPAEEVFAAPADEGVAAFLGADTTLVGRVTSNANGHVLVNVNNQQIEAVADVEVGKDVIVFLKPEDVTLWANEELPPSSARNRLAGKISRVVPRGPLVHLTIDCGFPIGALITRPSFTEMELDIGRRVAVTFKASTVHLIPR
jgi:tungstate transport system ATP-binding protein